MSQLNGLRKLLVAGAFVATLAMANTVDNEQKLQSGFNTYNTSHAAAVDHSLEAGAIGLLGSAAWLIGGRLRKRLQPPS